MTEGEFRRVLVEAPVRNELPNELKADRLLLTGAGWSKNWCGLLTEEFTNRLIGDKPIVADKCLHPIVREAPNFEIALEEARRHCPAESRQTLREAVIRVFEYHDRLIRKTRSEINIGRVEPFLRRFGPNQDRQTGYMFTLNQDLWIERNFHNFMGEYYVPAPTFPGINYQIAWFDSQFRTANFDDRRIRAQVDPSADISITTGFNIIKLHGSANWRTNGDLVVIGDLKVSQILKTKLLTAYNERFRDLCYSGGVRIMVIGYGYDDEHINETLGLGCKHFGLRIWTYEPGTAFPAFRQRFFQNRIRIAMFGEEIANGIAEHCDLPFAELFSPTDDTPEAYDDWIESFFEC
ncbi:MAG: SIR2 family protein [Armatimonadetes bacterium]|nr:SIR2 family protein [Armatimonadota bacterium]